MAVRETRPEHEATQSDVTGGDVDIGQRLRQVRRERDLNLSELSRRCGLTRSFLSQVENGRVSPSVASLTKIVGALDMTLGALFTKPAEFSPVVRVDSRPRLRYPGSQVDDELLSPTLSGKLEVLWAKIPAGDGSGDEPYTHNADEECIIVVTGALDITVDGVGYSLAAGDAITFCSRLPHRWQNPLDTETECVWIMTPPGF